MKYSYKDIKDKSKEGMKKELQEGINIAAAFFFKSYGMPLEIFQQLMADLGDQTKQWHWYMNFRNCNPKLFKKKKNNVQSI